MRANLERLKSVRQQSGSHAGLLLHRYVFHPADGSEDWAKEKRAVLLAAINGAAHEDVRALYRLAFDRWSAPLIGRPGPVDLQISGRLIVGLGTENVLEAGIRLHHTYGMPIIPGSALKGLAAHYCNRVWSQGDAKFAKPTKSQDEAYRTFLMGDGPEPQESFYRLLFGTTDDGGCIIFHDAWITPESKAPLALDVMTPHHLKWIDGSAPPTDFDGPTPVPFLSVTGTFRVAVSWRGPVSEQSEKWTQCAQSLLREALAEWGVGGKTSSGYGRLIVPPPPPPPPPPKKRASGEKARVRIVATRPKGGFEVQDVEPGRMPGTLTLGSPPEGINTAIGAIVDVLVHVEDPKRPQYKWPPLPKK